jgi:hypothetical protein
VDVGEGNVLGKVDRVTIRTGNSHGRVGREFLDLVDIGLVQENRAGVGLIRSKNHYKEGE